MLKIDVSFLKAVARAPLTYIMIALVFGIGVVFNKYTEKSDANDDKCAEREKRYAERIENLEKTLDGYTKTILLQRGEITNRNLVIDSLKNSTYENLD